MKPPRPGGSRSRARRGIGPDDRALWRHVTRDATPLDPALRATGDAPPDPAPVKAGPRRALPQAAVPPPTKAAAARPAVSPPVAPSVAARSLRPTGSGRKPAIGIDLADRAVAPVGRTQAGLDGRLTERLRQGERAPDGRIDLHGMTAERAHRALDRYIGMALARGERLVLIITGKGGKARHADDAAFMRADQGVLRQQAPNWLRNGPHAAHIVGIYQAHPRHGGAGAFYVYLKKPR
ncbi:MAG TPA: Smr/MutS family protein [Thermohalobaculum sp.]|nr:Smr/MutS family protein [Thermohalobaculum sp.]